MIHRIAFCTADLFTVQHNALWTCETRLNIFGALHRRTSENKLLVNRLITSSRSAAALYRKDRRLNILPNLQLVNKRNGTYSTKSKQWTENKTFGEHGQWTVYPTCVSMQNRSTKALPQRFGCVLAKNNISDGKTKHARFAKVST